MKKIKVGDYVLLDQFKCLVTSIFKDEDDGKEYAEVKPIEFESFEREVSISKIRKI